MNQSVRAFTTVSLAGLLLSCVSPHVASAGVNRWTSNGPGSGGSVYALALDPNTPGVLYAGGREGIFRSSDHGRSWNLLNTTLGGERQIVSIAVDPFAPTTLYASVGGHLGGIFKSTNGGRTWMPRSQGLSDLYFYGHKFVFDPVSPNTIYAGTQGLGAVLRSRDGGLNWTSIAQGQVWGVMSLAIDPSDPRRLYVGTDGGSVFRTTDAGASWQVVSRGFPGHQVMDLAIDPRSPSIVYAATYRGGVFKSINGGESWQRIGMSSHTALAIDSTNPANLYGALDGYPTPNSAPRPPVEGIYRSTDGGETSFGFNVGLPHYTSIFRLVIDPTGRFLHISTPGGVYDYEIREVSNPPIRLLPASQAISRTVSGNWTVLLDNAQTTETEVALGSSDVGVVRVPLSVTIPVGSTPATFSEMRSSFFPSPGIATVTAVLPENLGGGIATATVSVKPLIRTLSPSSVTAGGPAFVLTVSGSSDETEFTSASVVYWNGSPRPTTYGCPQATPGVSCLTANILASDIASPGIAYVVVINPPSGGTNGLTFTITAQQQLVEIPTLSEWGLLVLATLLAGAGILAARGKS